MLAKTKYKKDFLEPLVKNTNSMTELLKILNLKIIGGNFTHLKKVINHLNIDISHWKRNSSWNSNNFKKIPIENYFSNKNGISSYALKKKLIDENFFEEKCYSCHNTHWLNEKIPLELHHKDCNHKNNSLDNLIILCPNCHKIEHNKNKKSFKKVNKNNFKPSNKKVYRPNFDVLLSDIEKLGYVKTGKKYGVTDNSVRKWVKSYIKLGINEYPN